MMALNTDFKRATRDRRFMGVCGGIAHEYGWNPTLVRLAFVVVAIALPGVGTTLAFLAYVLLGVLLPRSEDF